MTNEPHHVEFEPLFPGYERCHCGRPVVHGYDGNPTHRRGMCERCDAVRCDAFPGACQEHADEEED